MHIKTKIHTALAASVFAGLFALPAYADENPSTKFLGTTGTQWPNLYDWAKKTSDSVDPDKIQNSDVIFDTSTEGWLGKPDGFGTKAADKTTNSVWNSITVRGNALHSQGLSLGYFNYNDGTDGCDVFYNLTINKDITAVNAGNVNIYSNGLGISNADGSNRAKTLRSQVHATLTVEGNINVNATSESSSYTCLRLGGTYGYHLASMSADTTGVNKQALDKLVVKKDVIVGGGNTLDMNIGTSTAYSETYDLSAPDALIVGRLVGYNGTDSNGNRITYGTGTKECWVSLSNIKDDGKYTENGRTSVYSIGGIDGEMYLLANSARYGKGSKFLTVINLTNTQDASVAGIADDAGGANWGWHCFSEKSKIKLIMNGTAEQRIYKHLRTSGGIEVNSGKLLVKSNIGGANGKNDSGTGDTTQYNHGKLALNGGTFGFYLGDKGGAFALDSIEYADGKIQLCVYSDSIDSLALENSVTTAGNAMHFDFVANNDDYSYITGDARLIVSWSSAPTGATYEADDITIAGTTYKATFTEQADGLYVQYTPSIPEPATFAAIFGVLALAFAAYRRRI